MANMAVTPAPLMRGWLHLGMAPIALVAGLALVVIAPSTDMRVALAVFTLSAVAMFTASATYHRGDWSPAWRGPLRRLDHSSIFLIIAGTYTPLAVQWLDPPQARLLLILIWSAALIGVTLRLTWFTAPRWVFIPIYLAMGWASLFYLPEFWTRGGALIVLLLAAGGLLYSAGAVVYALRWPGRTQSHFGYHEVFHALTIAAFACHYAAIALTVAAVD